MTSLSPIEAGSKFGRIASTSPKFSLSAQIPSKPSPFAHAEPGPKFGLIFPKIRLIVHLTELPEIAYNSVSSENSGKTKGNKMTSSTFQVFGKSLGLISEPELIAKGLGYEEARAKAQAALMDYCSHFGCKFEVTAGNGIFEAVKRIDDLYSWGYRITIEPEPEPVPGRESRLSLLDVRRAFDILREVIRLEGDDPEAESYRLSSVEVDLERILLGKVRIENGGLVIA